MHGKRAGERSDCQPLTSRRGQRDNELMSRDGIPDHEGREHHCADGHASEKYLEAGA